MYIIYVIKKKKINKLYDNSFFIIIKENNKSIKFVIINNQNIIYIYL